MALAITVKVVNKLQRDFLVRGVIVASGSYPTGGDVLDFTKAAYNLGVDGIKSSFGPASLQIFSQTTAAAPGTANYSYKGLNGTTQANSAMQVFTTTTAELAAGAYPAGVTGDVIEFLATFAAF